MNQSNLIQEVSLTGAVMDGESSPQYKTDTFVNYHLIERVKPTKIPEVMAVIVSGEVSYVLRKDIQQYFPDNKPTSAAI